MPDAFNNGLTAEQVDEIADLRIEIGRLIERTSKLPPHLRL